MKTLAILMLGALGACSTVPQQSFCSAARPILIAKADKLAPETERAIIGHNEIGQRLCGWTAPAK